MTLFLPLEFCNKHPLHKHLYVLVLLFYKSDSQKKWDPGPKRMCVLGYSSDAAYCSRHRLLMSHVDFAH